MVEEKLLVAVEKEGAVKRLEVKGEMKLVIHDPDDSKIVVKTNGIARKDCKSRLHPNLNTVLWNSENSLGLKDASKSFPVGSDNAVTILKWRLVSASEADMPITIGFWDSPENGRTTVNLTYKVEKVGTTLNDVHVLIPCKTREAPESTASDGSAHFDNKEKQLVWTIDTIADSNKSGRLDFTVPEMDGDLFFPLSVLFTSPNLFSALQVLGVVDAESGEDVPFALNASLSVEKFTVEKE